MAGHAPEYRPTEGRLERWLTDASDLQISFYMLLMAGAVLMAVICVDWRWLG